MGEWRRCCGRRTSRASGPTGRSPPTSAGASETDDGAVIVFSWHGYGVTTDTGERGLTGTITHLTGDPRYRWVNDIIGVICGEVRPGSDGLLDVVLEVDEPI